MIVKLFWFFVETFVTIFTSFERLMRIETNKLMFRFTLAIGIALTVGLMSDSRKIILADAPIGQWSAWTPLLFVIIVNSRLVQRIWHWSWECQWKDDACRLWFFIMSLVWLFVTPFIDSAPWVPDELMLNYAPDFFAGCLLLIGLAWWLWLLLLINKLTSSFGVPIVQKILDFLNRWGGGYFAYMAWKMDG